VTALLEYLDLEDHETDFFISWQPPESFFLGVSLFLKQCRVESSKGSFCVAQLEAILEK